MLSWQFHYIGMINCGTIISIVRANKLHKEIIFISLIVTVDVFFYEVINFLFKYSFKSFLYENIFVEVKLYNYVLMHVFYSDSRQFKKKLSPP